MNTGHDFSTSRFPKPLDTIITALGIALFVVFAAVGVNQAGDRQAVTGNNQRQAQSAHDEAITLASSQAFIETALANHAAQTQSDSKGAAFNEAKDNKKSEEYPAQRGQSVATEKSERRNDIDNRAQLE